MLDVARTFLQPRHGNRVTYVRADAAALPIAGRADAIFSTATFHWVLDHDRLFRSLFTALKPGGRLVSQCGGGPNIQRLKERAGALLREAPFARYFDRWQGPWLYADADATAKRLEAAGFVDVDTSVQPEPTVMPDEAAFREKIDTGSW